MRLKPVLFFLIVGGLCTYLVVQQAKEGAPGMINIGQMAPDFTIKDQSGKSVNLSDYRGNLVFLNFWASWCDPCIDEMPALETMNNSYKGRKFKMLTVSTDVNPDNAAEIYKKLNLHYSWYADPGRQVAGKYHVEKYPETFIIDANGHVLRHFWQVNTTLMSQIDGYLRNQEAAAATPIS